jgi:MFS family permease
VEALHAWHEFYILLGTAGATLLALLFVAVSLGSGYLSNRRRHQQGRRTFMSPVVIHFTTVFFISAVCLVPSHGPVFFAVLIGITAIIGIAVAIVITVWVVRTELTEFLQDYFAYGLLPVGGYLALLAASMMIYSGQDYALEVLAGGLLLLAVVNIRNAWDLTLSMVRRHANEKPKR